MARKFLRCTGDECLSFCLRASHYEKVVFAGESMTCKQVCHTSMWPYFPHMRLMLKNSGNYLLGLTTVYATELLCICVQRLLHFIKLFSIFFCFYASLLFSNTVITLFSLCESIFGRHSLSENFFTQILFRYDEFLLGILFVFQ